MSDLIKSISWKQFVHVVEAGRVLELQSCEVILPNGNHDFTVVIFHGDGFSRDYARTQSEYLALRTNSVGGKDLEELLKEIEEAELCHSLNSVVKTDVADLKSAVNIGKSKKSGVRRAKGKRKGSTRRSALASAGAMTNTPT